ncbi:hypothetical protein [uncultured Pontibacter sp.]|uniref:hypothetical protein n=1 Tax=uncultured Pontibacter sp. TaxID=453356 RepID=UPI0026028EBE|nr:hypothetical protein [uncultured Pontibacter sp.]
MKNVLFALLLLCALTSCSKEDDALNPKQTSFASDQYPQKWQLVSQSGNIANMPPLTGTNMSWQEFYILNANGSFTKTRELLGVATSASGTYKVEVVSGVNYLLLTYENDHELIGNCTVEPIERLSFKSDQILLNEWNICDGPGLAYKRVKLDKEAN